MNTASLYVTNQLWPLCLPALFPGKCWTLCVGFQQDLFLYSTEQLTLSHLKGVLGGNRMAEHRGQMANLENIVNTDQLRS